MFRRFPHIAVASLAALTIGLSACSNTTPTASPSANQQTTSQTSPAATNPESTADTAQKTADPDLASKILTGEVAGVTLKEMSEIPDLDSIARGADAQIEPAECFSTSITQLVAGASGVTQTGGASLLLSSDSAAPGKYKEYAQRCSSVSGTVSGSPFKQSIEKQQAPAVEGVNDLVAVIVTSDSTFGGKPVKTKGYLLIGSINGNTIIAQSLNLNDKEPPSEIITEIFKAQVEKLKG